MNNEDDRLRFMARFAIGTIGERTKENVARAARDAAGRAVDRAVMGLAEKVDEVLSSPVARQFSRQFFKGVEKVKRDAQEVMESLGRIK